MKHQTKNEHVPMDKETANYIIKYYPKLLNPAEAMAIRHYSSTFKMKGAPNREAIFLEKGWLTNDPDVLDLLKDGYDTFELRTATRMLSEHADQICINKCPKCGRLARTPEAKQCRCGHTWRI